jgi:hypothetical protein
VRDNAVGSNSNGAAVYVGALLAETKQ